MSILGKLLKTNNKLKNIIEKKRIMFDISKINLESLVELDVRDHIAAGNDPFEIITEAEKDAVFARPL